MSAVDTRAPAPELSRHLQETLDWHFDPATGSRFWLELAGGLGFDPRADIRSVADLRRFPDVGELLRTVPAEDLIPRGGTGTYEVFDSGGTTGAPKRVVDATSRVANADWCADVLDSHGFPARGNWLHIAPCGPHVVGRTVRRIAARRNGLFFTVDMDPRWVKKVLADGRGDLADEYVEHVLDQMEAIVATQDIRVLFITPPMLEAACARPAIYEVLSERLEGLLWAGTSAGPETLRLIEETLFPEAKVCGIYGNTLMGIAPQRPREPGDEQPCVFRPYHPASVVEIVDPETRVPVAYGERGQVLMHLLFRDMFLPNILERDTALRITPGAGDVVDGIASVLPVTTEEIVEGVY
ncbi:phenazine biosynthesis protein [Nonomuraea sp. NPDC050404]|uniref:phenazine biosynthesis protein n=1 Tax=Nonomuraea sp. NPDC050404 TaxID=3155783 RepID=UPI0033C491F3